MVNANRLTAVGQMMMSIRGATVPRHSPGCSMGAQRSLEPSRSTGRTLDVGRALEGEDRDRGIDNEWVMSLSSHTHTLT